MSWPLEKDLRVIAVSGHYGSGKDAWGEHLVHYLNDKRPESAELFKFANPLKRMAVQYFGWDGNKSNQRVSIDGQSYISGRKLLQGLGMALREEVDPLFWLKALEKSILDTYVARAKSQTPLRFAVITDTRFINEAKWAFNYGLLVKIERPGYHGDTDPSEAEMRTEDFKLYVTETYENTKDLHHLEQHAEHFANTRLLK